jgi:hypothetical protein
MSMTRFLPWIPFGLFAFALLVSSQVHAQTPSKQPAKKTDSKQPAEKTDSKQANKPSSTTPTPPATTAKPTNTAAPTSPPKEQEPPAVPRLHHSPVPSWTVGETLEIRAEIFEAHLVKKAYLIYQIDGGKLNKTAFLRSERGPYLAVVPADVIRGETLSYTIELELTSGKRVAAFASRAEMHPVQLMSKVSEARENAWLKRLEGRRSVLESTAEYVSFGSTNATVSQQDGTSRQLSVNDGYYRIEAGYTYRLLGPIMEFGIRGGVIRGRSPVPGVSDPSKLDVGLNYAAPSILVRVNDFIHARGEFLTSVTEVGFSVGGGGSVLFGDPYGTRLTLGFESIQVFGTRFYSRMDITAGSRVIIAPIVEITNMPHADATGVRLLTQVSYDVGSGWKLTAGGGYQARKATSGGPSIFGGVAYAF